MRPTTYPTSPFVELQEASDAFYVTAEAAQAQGGDVDITGSTFRLVIKAPGLNRHVNFPSAIDPWRAVAQLRNGVLDIVVPKHRDSTPAGVA